MTLCFAFYTLLTIWQVSLILLQADLLFFLFEGLFEELESTSESEKSETRAKQLGINGYGVSMTTLEEVFLELGKHYSQLR